jgi:hypothetical protein
MLVQLGPNAAADDDPVIDAAFEARWTSDDSQVQLTHSCLRRSAEDKM